MTKNLAPNLSPRKWRTTKTHDRYQQERQKDLITNICPLCAEKPIITFKHWLIIPNKYPYDAVSEVHDLLQPIRHVDQLELLNEDEGLELSYLKKTYLNDNYTYFVEALPKSKSIPGHLHYHLIEPKVIN